MGGNEQQQQQELPWWQRAVNWGGDRLDEVGSIAGDAAGVLEAAGKLGRSVPDVGPLGDVGDIMSGVGKLAHFDDEGNWDPNWGGAGDLVAGGAGLAARTPGVGAAVGGTAQALTNGYQAYEHFSAMSNETDPEKRAELERKAWGSTGDATIGALHAGLGSWCPVAELYISGGELALDSVGAVAGWVGGDDAKFGAGDAVGGLLDAVIPEEEDAWSNQAGNWVHDQLGGGTLGTIGGAATAGLTNAALAPVNIADATAGGVVNTIGNMFDSDDGKRDDYWGDFKGWAGDQASAAGGAIADGASAAWNWAGDTASAAGGAIADGASAAWNWAGDTASAAGGAIADGASTAWNWAGDTASAAGGAIADGASTAWNWAGDTASAAGGAIADGASTAWNWAGDTASAAGSAISDGAGAVADGAGRAWDTVTSW